MDREIPLPKLVASDIGGTLVADIEAIPPFTARVLNRLVERDIPVALITGFNYNTTLEMVRGLDPRVLLLPQNGTLCLQGNRVLWEHGIPRERARELYDFLQAQGFPVIVYKGRLGNFENYYIYHRELPLSYGFRRVEQLEDFNHIGGISTLIPDVDARPAREKIRRIVGERFQVIYTRSGENAWLEIVPGRVRKDLAIRELCRELGVEPVEVIYFGDNFNDLEALRLVGHPVVMENGRPELKREFPFWAGSVDCEGVARHLDELFDLGLGA